MRPILKIAVLLLGLGLLSGCKALDHELNYAGNTGAVPGASDYSSGTLWSPKSK